MSNPLLWFYKIIPYITIGDIIMLRLIFYLFEYLIRRRKKK